ncbi:cupin domain-containing protein [Roseinatronobacter alkalisoli]|uniref:Cupin domain-containing protein n=1 Tax=Roseinatronobacter alkalisoli TaxID=3028235 RepID=A0ABT5T6S3_9RHOB|nr:cupin domain-containing protein [Roseinatronobacter sp. HJB301]MDD7970671.1 cupin domain-containing protein [Roseinatronobacter sp. HJB301]
MKDLTDDPGAIEWLGVKYKTILTPEQTGGTMSIVDSLSPVNSGPPRHIHENEDETFVVITGICKIWLEGTEFLRGPGESAFIPRGRNHSFRVVGDEPSRHLVILTPGGFEGFFADMAAGQFRIPEDMPEIAESARRHNLTFTGPPID